MFTIQATAKNNGEKFFYTTRSGRHDLASARIAAREFSTWIEADQTANRLRAMLAFSDVTLTVIDDRAEHHVAGQSHSD